MFNLFSALFRTNSMRVDPSFSHSLDAFDSEAAARNSDAGGVGGSSLARGALLGLLVVVAGIGGYVLNQWRPLIAEAAQATVTIESRPAGAEVFDGAIRRGVTPLTLVLPGGTHEYAVVNGDVRKRLSIDARPGTVVVHHVELEAAPAPPAKAALEIVTEPAKLQVLVNGVRKGVSPLTLTGLAAGRHDVQVIGTNGTFERRVELGAGETASVIISAGARAPGPAAGWLTVVSAFPVQILDGREIVGTSQSPRIMLAAGRYELQLANDALGFSQRRAVQVVAGKTATISVERPQAPLNINAVPWANVWVDGKPAGETPIGNLLVGIGVRELVFRHPELGERRQTVTVALGAPNRVSTDMRKSQ